MIPHSKIILDEEDIAVVARVLRSGHLAQGDYVLSLEEKAASFIKADHAAAVSSGTAALHLSLLALGIGEGSEVIIPSYVCTALMNAVQYVRATPVLADIDPDTYNIDVDCIKHAITDRTRAIIVPHMFGLPADIEPIISLGIPVIEDCAQSIGARLGGKYAGSFGTLSIFSFYATKMLGAGEGGMVASNDPRLIETIRDLRDYDEKETYVVRYNYKMTDIMAALCESRIKKLPSFIHRRKEIAKTYDVGLSDLKLGIPLVPERREHVYYRYNIELENPIRFMDEMHKRDIHCRRPVFKPIHRYLQLPGFPNTDDAWEKAVSIPIYPALKQEEAYFIINTITSIL
ncbi:MAG: DegT/DnrJ/EryC1/StrS family aminotransferase, partial [Deltaproteobacteria bacterium]|nr:DegT/DnrJ/EryC1/StrS family aminotransferase [Deltaproteobacteria bacterium]